LQPANTKICLLVDTQHVQLMHQSVKNEESINVLFWQD